jgi:hypothetical protein
VPRVVRATLRDPGGFERRVPLAAAPRVEADVAASERREQERRVEARRQGLDGGRRAAAQRDPAPRRLRVRRQETVGEPPLDDDGGTGEVNVAPLDRDPLVRPQARLGGDDGERPEDRAELGGKRVDPPAPTPPRCDDPLPGMPTPLAGALATDISMGKRLGDGRPRAGRA